MKHDFESTAARPGDQAGPTTATGTPPVLTLDVSLYEDYLENGDLTEEQKREFLEALWVIIVGFVDLGFGIHPVQQAWEANGGEQTTANGGTDAPCLPPFQPNTQEEDARALPVGLTGGAAEKEEK